MDKINTRQAIRQICITYHGLKSNFIRSWIPAQYETAGTSWPGPRPTHLIYEPRTLPLTRLTSVVPLKSLIRFLSLLPFCALDRSNPFGR
jgi:hypothetical protein